MSERVKGKAGKAGKSKSKVVKGKSKPIKSKRLDSGRVESRSVHRSGTRKAKPSETRPGLHESSETVAPTDYGEFLRTKLIETPPAGLTTIPDLNPSLFPFQRDAVEWSLRKGRAALFLDCGLGKTLCQLDWARVVAAHTGGRVLILAPLAVSQQTIREGAKFGIEVKYAHDQSEVAAPVTITNYERLDRFDPASFSGVVLDESSILKSFTGTTKRALLAAFRDTPFRLACTATPAPNDHMEIGNHAEFLGVLTSHEMLARWFVNDSSTFGTYRLKGHAVESFWDWVTSWARCASTPSDIGHSDDGYILPELRIIRHVVDVDVTEDRGGNLFRIPEMSATAVHREKRRTAGVRAEKVAELVAAQPGESWILWIETDYDADALLECVPDLVDVRGSMSLERKERALAEFTDGTIRVLSSKPKLAGFGLNWQHCARVLFNGPSYSFEQWYQATRRSWRFGQTRSVECHIVMAATEVATWNVVERKRADHAQMVDAMRTGARRAFERASRRGVEYEPRHLGRWPEWLRTEAGSDPEARRTK